MFAAGDSVTLTCVENCVDPTTPGVLHSSLFTTHNKQQTKRTHCPHSHAHTYTHIHTCISMYGKVCYLSLCTRTHVLACFKLLILLNLLNLLESVSLLFLLSLSRFLAVSICLSIYQFIYLTLSLCLSVCLSLW